MAKPTEEVDESTKKLFVARAAAQTTLPVEYQMNTSSGTRLTYPPPTKDDQDIPIGEKVPQGDSENDPTTVKERGSTVNPPQPLLFAV